MIMDGRELAKQIRKDLATKVTEMTRNGQVPCLSVFLVGDDPASAVYVRNKKKACEEIGIKSEIILCSANITQKELEQAIQNKNQDEQCSGILVQLPLPKSLDCYRSEILNKVSVYKDVDGFHSDNLGKLVQNISRFVPCTVRAIKLLIDTYKIPLIGRRVCIINDTIVVGKPLAMLLQNEGATVTMCNHLTLETNDICRSSDIVISAVGKRHKFCVSADMVKRGAAVIDVGISRVDDKIIGDIEFDEVSKKAGWITPCPGGVGPLTISELLRNTIQAAKDINENKTICTQFHASFRQ